MRLLSVEVCCPPAPRRGFPSLTGSVSNLVCQMKSTSAAGIANYPATLSNLRVDFKFKGLSSGALSARTMTLEDLNTQPRDVLLARGELVFDIFEVLDQIEMVEIPCLRVSRTACCLRPR